MKILLFSTAYLPHIGGAEIAVKEITDRVPGIEFDLLTAKLKRGLPDFEKIGNVNVYRIGAGNKFFDKPLLPNLGFLKAINLHKQKKYDLIHGIMASQGSAAAYLFKFFYPKVPFVLTLQEGDLGRNSPFDKFWQRRIIKKADAITAISSYLAEFVIKFNKKSPIYMIPNGVDFNKFFSSNIKSRTGENIITVSRLVKKNGIDILVKAFRILINKNSFPNIKLTIVGSGPEDRKIKKLANTLGIADKINFIGAVPNEKIPKYLADADIFVRPSRSEGLGTAFLEAMICGVPIIGTRVGGIPDFLKERETGLFSKLNDAEDLAQKVEELLKDKNFMKRMVESGSKLVREKYNWDNIAIRMREVYEKTVSSHTGI